MGKIEVCEGGWKSLYNAGDIFEPRRTTAKRRGFLLPYKYSLTHPVQSPRIHYMETFKTQGFLDYLILYKFFEALTLQSHAAWCKTAMKKNSVADLGCLSRILIFTHPGSRIPDPKTATKGRGENL
jgi:hypothetical protein